MWCTYRRVGAGAAGVLYIFTQSRVKSMRLRNTAIVYLVFSIDSTVDLKVLTQKDAQAKCKRPQKTKNICCNYSTGVNRSHCC
jgi:hypothetical protein